MDNQNDPAALGQSGKSFFNSLKQSVKDLADYTGIYGKILNIPKNLPRQMIQTVSEIDAAMSSLYQVTDATASMYNKFLDNASAKSKAVGRDMLNYIQQTAKWSKLGYSLDKADKLSGVSSLYANVTGVNDSTAISDMEAAIKAYTINASEAMKIVDSYSALGSKFSANAQEIGAGISNIASSLAAAGNDFDQSVSMITGMSEITHSVDAAGSALKSLSMHLRGYNDDTKSYSNDVEALSNSIAVLTRTAKTPGGISLFTDGTMETYKSAYQVMQEISQVWDNLTDGRRSQLSEILAGPDNSGQISALVQAFQSGTIQKAYDTSINAGGSALEEQASYLDSLQAKIVQFKSTFQDLSNTTVSSDLLKGFVDTGTLALEVVTSLVNSFGSLTSVAGILGGIFAQKKGVG